MILRILNFIFWKEKDSSDTFSILVYSLQMDSDLLYVMAETKYCRSKNLVSFKIRYVIALSLQILELKKNIWIGHTVAEILNVKVREINNFGDNFLFYFIYFL